MTHHSPCLQRPLEQQHRWPRDVLCLPAFSAHAVCRPHTHAPPPMLCTFNATTIDLSQNTLSALPELTAPLLEKLDITGNFVRTLPDSFRSLKHLTQLFAPFFFLPDRPRSVMTKVDTQESRRQQPELCRGGGGARDTRPLHVRADSPDQVRHPVELAPRAPPHSGRHRARCHGRRGPSRAHRGRCRRRGEEGPQAPAHRIHDGLLSLVHKHTNTLLSCHWGVHAQIEDPVPYMV